MKTEKAYFAGGCFWGVEYYFRTHEGVVETTVGYCGGDKDDPTYDEVCHTDTGHAETVEVEYDPNQTSFKHLAQFFFSLHDFGQVDQQGPDIGKQYRSEIFYVDEDQKKEAEELIDLLNKRGYKVVTHVTKFVKFWPAEEYHQDYYDKTGGEPYCHLPRLLKF